MSKTVVGMFNFFNLEAAERPARPPPMTATCGSTGVATFEELGSFCLEVAEVAKGFIGVVGRDRIIIGKVEAGAGVTVKTEVLSHTGKRDRPREGKEVTLRLSMVMMIAWVV
jgi:hypothetical protein